MNQTSFYKMHICDFISYQYAKITYTLTLILNVRWHLIKKLKLIE